MAVMSLEAECVRNREHSRALVVAYLSSRHEEEVHFCNTTRNKRIYE